MCLSLQPLVVGGDVSVCLYSPWWLEVMCLSLQPLVVGGDVSVSVFTAPGGWR